MTREVSEMIAARHSAEQRGAFSPLGRLLWMQTERGTIQFPAVDGVGTGPDIGLIIREGDNPTPDAGAFLVLGEWLGLPPLRKNSSKPCPKCLHACDICRETGKKLCELCGGKKTRAGQWLPCPAPGCTKETGKFKPDCSECQASGMVRDQLACEMCDSSGLMTCPRCKGAKKYSTGRAGGSIDWKAKKCKACDGTCFVGEWQAQSLKKFTNARLQMHETSKCVPRKRSDVRHIFSTWLALGPILCFGVRNFETLRGQIFDVIPDGRGDLLMLLVPASTKQKKQKAYLVGGVARARQEVRSA